MSELKPAAQRVQDALRAKGPRQQGPAHGPDHAHRRGGGRRLRLRRRPDRQVAGVPRRQSGKPYLLLVSGANRVDEKAVAAPHRRAAASGPTPNTCATATGFAIGGIPPLGHDTPLATFMDEALLAYDVVWAAAGTPDAVFPVAPAQLAEAAAAAVIPVG